MTRPAPIARAQARVERLRAQLARAEIDLLAAALRETSGDRSAAAHLLAMPLRTFHRRLAEHPELRNTPEKHAPAQPSAQF